MYQFKLPDVGEGIHEAEILNWLVKEGDTVKINQPILEIQTDKAIVEIPSPVAGMVAHIQIKAGTLAHVGDTLITFATDDGPPPEPKKSSNGQTRTTPATQTAGIAGPGQRILAAPAVRKMALTMGINLTDVPGTGPAGRVLPDDIKRYAEQQKAPPAEAPQSTPQSAPQPTPTPRPAPTPSPSPQATSHIPRPASEEITAELPLQGLRRRIAERMEQAWQIPHVTSFDEIEVSKLVALRKELQPEAERCGVRLSYMPFIIKAVVQTLKSYPIFNASLDMEGQKILHHHYYHIGVATAVPDGLLVPVLRHADQMTLIDLAVEMKRLAVLAQERKLGVAELSGSTFTLTNFGSYGSRMGTPIINAPEVAILGTGRIEERPVAEEGELVIRPILPLALSFDHRLIDGATSGQFVSRLRTLLNNPKLLLLELV